MQKRAELLTHIQNTASQYNLEPLGRKIAYKANRQGVAEHFPDPDVRGKWEYTECCVCARCQGESSKRQLQTQLS